MEIDHVFFFVEADGPEIARMAALGLIETYRRTHVGQGTQNVCYCFDNLFLELFWVKDAVAVRSEGVRRTGLYERSLWRTNGACPFGIAWRQSPGSKAPAIATWPYLPPYLPEGVSIPIAMDSEDVRQPLLFASPGATAPMEWPAERRKTLQRGAGLGAVLDIGLRMPADVDPSPALKKLAAGATPGFWIDTPGAYRLRLRVSSLIGKPELEVELPLLS